MKFETPEQRSRKLQTAAKHLASVQDQHSEILKTLATCRRKMHAITGPAVPNEPDAKRERLAEIGKARADLNDAIAKRDALRAAVEQAKLDHAAESSKACFDLVASAKPEYLQNLRAFVLARLERLAPEIVAATQCAAIRYGLTVALGVQRASKINRLGLALDLPQAIERFERLKAETQEAIDNQIIKPADVPKELRTVWNL